MTSIRFRLSLPKVILLFNYLLRKLLIRRTYMRAQTEELILGLKGVPIKTLSMVGLLSNKSSVLSKLTF